MSEAQNSFTLTQIKVTSKTPFLYFLRKIFRYIVSDVIIPKNLVRLLWFNDLKIHHVHTNVRDCMRDGSIC